MDVWRGRYIERDGRVDRRQAGAECIVLHLIAGISRTVTAERPRWDMFPPGHLTWYD